ncbi:M20 family metallopeptidase [Terrisporobacter petrolearius]|uniref:M20 family metallopeptidase n=1 Tax=Terrisporobacter petrolearius TaxID=1460447 RepID=UPI001D15F302|nr:M20 family metallopeptidase [Terrisporobacter petrolearius]MCC3863545.1 M20 family metallopeptidase [Terrisporobacter petrolearius]
MNNQYEKVMEKLDSEGLIKFTQELIQINSVYDPEDTNANETNAAQYVFDFLQKEGFEVYMEEAVKNRPNVIAFLRGDEEGKTILFEGHTDVVSAGDFSQWTYNPFGGEIVKVNGKERIYGRGACDTKQNLAAAIYAAKAIKDSNEKFKGNILLCIPCDEEGLMLGIKSFIKNGWADNVNAAVICEPEEKNLCIFQKGALRIKINFYGKMAHGCMPLSGNCPNWAVGKVICELRRLETFEKYRLGRHEYLGYPSITPTMIQTPINGVSQINVIPSDAYVTLDIRTVPGQEHEGIKRQIQGILDDFSSQFREGDDKFTATIEVLDDRPWTETSRDEPVVKSIAKAYRNVMKAEPIYNGVPGATDGTFIQCQKGIPVIVTGAGDREVPHQVDEWCELEDIIETSKIYILTALYYLNEEY